jgi:hypothetical protein
VSDLSIRGALACLAAPRNSQIAALREDFADGELSIVASARLLIEAGQLLIAKKKNLPSAAWLPWLTENADTLGFSSQTAQRLMKVAREYCISDISDADEAFQVTNKVWPAAGRLPPL